MRSNALSPSKDGSGLESLSAFGTNQQGSQASTKNLTSILFLPRIKIGELTILVAQMLDHTHSAELDGLADVAFPRPHAAGHQRLNEVGVAEDALVRRRLGEVFEETDAAVFELDVGLGVEERYEVRGERDGGSEERNAVQR